MQLLPIADGKISASPFPASNKIYVQGVLYPEIRVPVRRVSMNDNTEELFLYDTSGPYTDPLESVDMRQGLAPLRSSWILARNDTRPWRQDVDEPRPDFQNRQPDLTRRPRRANADKIVTQMHYAKQGIITPET